MQLLFVRAPGKPCLVPGSQSIGVTVRGGQYLPTGHSGPQTGLELFGSLATKPATQSSRHAMLDEKSAVNWPRSGIHVPRAHVHTMGAVMTMVGEDALWLRNVQLDAVLPLLGLA